MRVVLGAAREHGNASDAVDDWRLEQDGERTAQIVFTLAFTLAFLGWLGAMLMPDALTDVALADHVALIAGVFIAFVVLITAFGLAKAISEGRRGRTSRAIHQCLLPQLRGAVRLSRR